MPSVLLYIALPSDSPMELRFFILAF
jgi:hypothetical protein